MIHGHGGYTQGCRCTICTTARRDYNREYMRASRARQATGSIDTTRARADALAILAADETTARILISHWKVGRLRDALIVLAAAVPPETPISQIGHVA